MPEGTVWNANLHLRRTEGLAGDNPHKAVKECNECYYAPTKGERCTPAMNGTFNCCGEDDYDGVAACPTVDDPPPPKNYSLRYTFSYTRNMSAIQPLQVGSSPAPRRSWIGVDDASHHASDDASENDHRHATCWMAAGGRWAPSPRRTARPSSNRTVTTSSPSSRCPSENAADCR